MHFAVISGICAPLGSLFGKLSGLPAFEGYFLIRIILFIIMLLLNTSAMTFFVKSLHSRNSTLTATVVSTATNYILSAILGFTLFGESTSLLWWLGMSLIFCGIVLILNDENEEIKQKPEHLKL